MKRRKRRIMAILLAIAMIFTMVDPSIFGGTVTVQAEETTEKETGNGWSTDGETFYIKDASNLEYVVTHYTDTDVTSDGPKLRNARFVVTDNINLGTSSSNRINIGTEEYPFKNEFDGQGYTISGLKFDEVIATNGGLFGIMDTGAIIKNLIIDNAHIRSNHYGGVLAAQARDAIIQNVTIKNSSCKIASMGNVVGLITTGGLYGGALVGYADNTKIYNCESRNTSVYVDTTGAIQALGGDGMYMGGLVGWMDNGSILEYSRVVGGEVSTEYYVAVGALAANILYAGGLVGHIDGSDTGMTQILDCFSSAKVSYDGDCYVSVGAGLTGYAGGIAARVSGTNYKMERCHFAGNLSGSLLNSILVLPVVAMEDYYLGGVAGQVENSSNIHNCYFNWDKAIVNNDRKKVPAIYGESNRGDVTTIGEAQYSNPTFFVTFDFKGTDEKTTGNAAPFDVPHANKWVINPANNMPVHGSAVQAEIDFPGAGTISFAATSIQSEQKTNGLSDKSSDLANGTTITQIAQTHAEMNEELTLTATVEPGYNFEGWYLRRDGVEKAILAEQYGSKEENYKMVLGGDSESNYEYKDGDVFVAKYTANVLFRNIDDTDNYNSMKCTYQQVINPSRVEIESTGYIFLGWTQTQPTGELDKDHLTTINIDKTGIIEDTISVTTPITLYPVFISIGNYNVQVQMESAPLQEDGNKGRIGTEGTAVVKVDEDGNLFISVEDINVKEEEGYHFDGWYKLELDENGTMQTDENGKAKGELVSRSQTYSLKNIDLNNKYRYEARYKYRVKTYVPVKFDTDGFLEYNEEEGYIGDYYVSYGININDKEIKQIPNPTLNSEEVLFTHWNDKPLGGNNHVIGWNDLKTEALKEAPEIKITQPKSIYAVIYWNPESDQKYYHSIIANTDFPAGTAEISVTDYHDSLSVEGNNGNVSVTLQLNEGYNFNGIWQYFLPRYGINPTWKIWASNDDLDCVGKLASWDSKKSPYFRGDTRILARVTADIVLHTDKDNPETTETVTRKYNSRLFNYTNGDEIYNSTENWDKESDKIADPIYKVTDDVLNPIGTGETPRGMDMYKDGYKFLGWTDNAEIFNVEGDDHYVTTDLSSVDAYILDDAVRVTEKMELYPVYVKYDIHTYTSFSKSTLASTNQPEKPDYVAKDNGTVTLNLKQIPKDFESNERYVFKDWRVESEDNNAKVESKENEYILEADYSEKYDIYAEYTAIVSFKNATGENSDINKEYEYDEEIGELPITQLPVGSEVTIKPGESINGYKDVFVGWKDLIISDNSPQNDGKINCPQTDVAKYSFISKDKKIEGAINLWPVYTRPSISLESNVNINDDQQATITISENGAVTLNAPKQDGYVFTGWSLNGESFAETDTYTLSPEQLRSDKEYKFTANYDIVVTYMIPNVSDDNKLTEYYTPMEASIPEGEKIGDGQYSVAPTIAAMSALEKAGYMFGGWALKDGTTEYISEITEPITLYPLTNQAKLSVYSNIDDTTTTLTVNQNQKDGMITFPTEPAELAESKSKLPTGVTPQSEVVSSFIGYSLVEITRNEKKEEISRTSKALYKAGDTISAKDLSAYNGTGNYRIYAVWSQIQNIPNGSIYKDEENDREGLITAAAVNTKILANAGLKNNESKYERRILYSKGSKYMDIATDETAWNNTLYKDYFDNSYNTDDANWDIYVSFLYNIASPTDEYGVCPYLKFSYSSDKVGNFRDKTNPTYEHSLRTVAEKLLSLEDNVQESYSWHAYKDLIESYIGEQTNE